MAQLIAPDAEALQASRTDQLLDLLLYQLARHSMYARGRRNTKRRLGGRRRPCARIRIERNIANIKRATKTWRSITRRCDNGPSLASVREQGLPALYFVDAQGASDIIISARVNRAVEKLIQSCCAKLEPQVS